MFQPESIRYKKGIDKSYGSSSSCRDIGISIDFGRENLAERIQKFLFR